VEMTSASVTSVSVMLLYCLMVNVILNATLLSVIMIMKLTAKYPDVLPVLMTNLQTEYAT